ncbi:hypothetical protein C3F36_11130 [Aeromonas sp. ASNIH2]|nr:hypothetical protein C3F36_11130 [Aeromonas sp. ASNIH2]
MVWISSKTKRLTTNQEDDYFKTVELRKDLIKIANVYNYLLALTSKEYTSGFTTSGIQIISATLMDEWREVANC